VPEFKTW
jgi:serine/threonine protein kinase